MRLALSLWVVIDRTIPSRWGCFPTCPGLGSLSWFPLGMWTASYRLGFMVYWEQFDDLSGSSERVWDLFKSQSVIGC